MASTAASAGCAVFSSVETRFKPADKLSPPSRQMTRTSRASGSARRKLLCRLRFVWSSQKLGPISPAMQPPVTRISPSPKVTTPTKPAAMPRNAGAIMSNALTPRKTSMASWRYSPAWINRVWSLVLSSSSVGMSGMPILGRVVDAIFPRVIVSVASPPGAARSRSRELSRVRRPPTSRETRSTRLLTIPNAAMATGLFVSMRGIPLEVEIDDLPDPQAADRLADRGHPEQRGVFQEQAGIRAVHEQHKQKQPRGKAEQDHGLHPPLGGQGLDLAPQLVTLANDMRKLVQELGQVAAGLLLDEHGEHEDLQFQQAGATSQLAEGRLGGKSQVLLLEAEGELSGDRR